LIRLVVAGTFLSTNEYTEELMKPKAVAVVQECSSLNLHFEAIVDCFDSAFLLD